MMCRSLFEGVTHTQDRRFIERLADQLEPDRHSLAQPTGHGESRQTCQIR